MQVAAVKHQQLQKRLTADEREVSDRRGEGCGGCCGTCGDTNKCAATTATQGAAVNHQQLQQSSLKEGDVIAATLQGAWLKIRKLPKKRKVSLIGKNRHN